MNDWGNHAIVDLFAQETGRLHVNQLPSFTLVHESSVEDADEVILTDEEIDEGSYYGG